MLEVATDRFAGKRNSEGGIGITHNSMNVVYKNAVIFCRSVLFKKNQFFLSVPLL